jgi:hypothetical protein
LAVYEPPGEAPEKNDGKGQDVDRVKNVSALEEKYRRGPSQPEPLENLADAGKIF